MNKEKFEKLKTMGRTELGTWPDYLALGFDSSDIKQLLEIVKFDSNINSDEDNDSAYESIHAWRVLGQLSDSEIIEPLIALLNQYAIADDDWSLSEFPKVLGMLGKEAIEPLIRFVCVKSNEKYARINASDSLCEIFKLDESLRDNVVQAYGIYLEDPDVNAYELNGLMIGRLMKLKAHELLDSVRELFKKDIVDLSICGNLDDFEMALGIRIKRSMSEPDYRKRIFGNHTPKSEADLLRTFNNSESYKLIEETLEKYINDYSINNISQLNGYLASIVCSDAYVGPSKWSLDIWGGDEHEPQWDNYEEYKTFNNDLFDYFKFIESHIEEYEYEPLINKGSKISKKLDWGIGFMRGIQYWDKSVDDFEIQASLQYANIAILANDNAQETFETLGLGAISKNFSEFMAHAVFAIYDEMHLTQEDIETYHQPDSVFSLNNDVQANKNNYQSKEPYVREGIKVGRNDPCPCDSGKKYKKCCMNK